MAKKPNFENLGIPDFLVNKLVKDNIKNPTEVQIETIPLVLQGKDIIAQSPTGTGKTLAYLLPLLAKLNVESKNVQLIILAPHRELAVQITKLANELMGDMGILTVPILGGVNPDRQLDSLKKKPQLIVGTPGRVLELIRKRKINSQTVKTIVVDESDKMWKIGFKEDVEGVIKSTLRDRQVVMVSATVSPEFVANAVGMLNNPEMVNVSKDSQIADTVKHIYFTTQEKAKAGLFNQLMAIYKPKKVIVFINSNKGVKPFVKRFAAFGFHSDGLYGELNPQEKKLVLERFRSGKVTLLVTTDLFARGMDVKAVDIVVNFDLPADSEQYIHRVGRTGRAGNKGLAINFVTAEQKFIMPKYESQLGIKIDEYAVNVDKVFPLKNKFQQKTVVRSRQERKK